MKIIYEYGSMVVLIMKPPSPPRSLPAASTAACPIAISIALLYLIRITIGLTDTATQERQGPDYSEHGKTASNH